MSPDDWQRRAPERSTEFAIFSRLAPNHGRSASRFSSSRGVASHGIRCNIFSRRHSEVFADGARRSQIAKANKVSKLMHARSGEDSGDTDSHSASCLFADVCTEFVCFPRRVRLLFDFLYLRRLWWSEWPLHLRATRGKKALEMPKQWSSRYLRSPSRISRTHRRQRRPTENRQKNDDALVKCSAQLSNFLATRSRAPAPFRRIAESERFRACSRFRAENAGGRRDKRTRK